MGAIHCSHSFLLDRNVEGTLILLFQKESLSEQFLKERAEF